MVTITKIIRDSVSVSLKINKLAFQGVNSSKDPVTKKDTDNEIKAENKVIKMKEKMRGTRSLQIKRNYVHNEDLI